MNDCDEVIGGDVRSDGVRIGVLGRAPHAVGGQQDPTLEHEVLGTGGASETIQERLQRVPDWILLRRRTRPSLRRGGACCGLDVAEHLIADVHTRASNAWRTGDFARGSREAISISRAGFPPRRSHSFNASRASSYPTSPRSRNASVIDRSGE